MAGRGQGARGMNGGTAVIVPCLESISPFPGDILISFGKPLISYSCLFWLLQKRLALHPAPQEHHQAQVPKRYLAYSKFLATVMCMGLKEKQSGTRVEPPRR